MVESLRALLSGAIDYAGLFQPASLPLDQAIEEFAAHEQSAEAWMLAGFVCPAEQVAGLRGQPSAIGKNWPLAILAGGGANWATFVPRLREDLRTVSSFIHEYDALEVRLPALAGDEPQRVSLGRMVHEVVADVLRWNKPLTKVYFELADLRPEMDEVAWQRMLESVIEVLTDYGQSSASNCCAAGFKLRTGGTDAAAFPSSRQLAIAICMARDAGLFWKATAGLHHSLPQQNPQLGVRMHGFVNLLTSAVLADAQRLCPHEVEQILEDVDAHDFEWADDHVRWRGHTASIAQIVAARGELQSFGSCSFDEPRHDLRALGWLDEAVGSRR